MCGIIGIVGKEEVAQRLVDGLRRLEYRGYDSAGIATLDHGKIERVRAEGKLINLDEKLKTDKPHGTTGIGHTRWATHGGPDGAQCASSCLGHGLRWCITGSSRITAN